MNHTIIRIKSIFYKAYNLQNWYLISSSKSHVMLLKYLSCFGDFTALNPLESSHPASSVESRVSCDVGIDSPCLKIVWLRSLRLDDGAKGIHIQYKPCFKFWILIFSWARGYSLIPFLWCWAASRSQGQPTNTLTTIQCIQCIFTLSTAFNKVHEIFNTLFLRRGFCPTVGSCKCSEHS